MSSRRIIAAATAALITAGLLVAGGIGQPSGRGTAAAARPGPPGPGGLLATETKQAFLLAPAPAAGSAFTVEDVDRHTTVLSGKVERKRVPGTPSTRLCTPSTSPPYASPAPTGST